MAMIGSRAVLQGIGGSMNSLSRLQQVTRIRIRNIHCTNAQSALTKSHYNPIIRPILIAKPTFTYSLQASRSVSFSRKALAEASFVWRWTFRFIGFSTVFVVVSTVGFFIYDATTYHPRNFKGELNISHLAISPNRGGEKNLPIANVLVDDEDTPEHVRSETKPKLVILGTGWAAVQVLKDINPEDWHIVVVSPTNYFLFTPLLPSATVGTVGIRSLVESIRRLMVRARAHFLEASARDIDLKSKLIECYSTDEDTGVEQSFYVPYDRLIVAVGSVTNTHGAKGMEFCHFLKTVKDARKIQNHLITNLEKACLPSTSEEERKRLLSFVVCGAGPTGVEFAAELVDALQEDVAPHYPRLVAQDFSVNILQSSSHILNTYEEKISQFAEQKFLKDEINVIKDARVQEIDSDKVIYTTKDAAGNVINKEIPAGMVLWSTGVALAEFAENLRKRLPIEQTNKRALETDPYCRVLGTPMNDIYAIGDCSTVQNNIAGKVIDLLKQYHLDGGRDPATAQLNLQQWRKFCAGISKQYPATRNHLKHMSKLFDEFDKDKSGRLDVDELRDLLKSIDVKLTSLPATAQRAHQQGAFLAKRLNMISKNEAHMQVASRADDSTAANENTASTSLVLDDGQYDAFEYKHLGSLVYLGNSAVLDAPAGTLAGGLIAMYLWRSVYFSQQVSFRTRALLAFDWAKRGIWGRDLSRT